MAKLNIASVVTVLLLLHLIFASVQAEQTNESDQATPAPTPIQWDRQSCFDLLDGKNKTNYCPNDVLKFIGAIPRDGCGAYCHLSRACCIATVALDLYHPECWKYFMNKNASENARYMLVMTCAKSIPSV